MMINRRIYIMMLQLVIICTTGCKEPFIPDVSGYENLMVVEGLITDEPGYSYVKLSKSYPLDSIMFQPVSANVFIIENDKTRIDLIMQDKKPGLYRLPDSFIPSIGAQYVLHFEVSADEKYTSTSVTLLKTPAIDSIYYEIERLPNGDNEAENYLQLYLDTHDPTNSIQYYRWHWEEVYEIRTQSTSFWLKDKNGIRPRTAEEMIDKCWIYDTTKSIHLYNTEHLSDYRISHFPLEGFLPSKSYEPKYMYCINVEQYALNKENYQFYKQLKNISEGMGTLFDPLPTQVVGNITNDRNPKLPVLGTFEASTVERKRFFLDGRRYKGLFFDASIFPNCESHVVEPKDIDRYLSLNYLLLDPVATPPTPGKPVHFLMELAKCASCKIYGTTNRPEYWPD